MAGAQRDISDCSIFGDKFNITRFKADPLRWNNEWDKVLQTLTAKDAYATLSLMWDKARWEPHVLSQQAEELKHRVYEMQKTLVKLWDDLEEKGHFVTAWLLLEEKDRQAHLMKGLEEACRDASWGQDSRALCPEIRTSLMLKQRGKAYINLISGLCKGKKEVGENDMYHFPSRWWEDLKAVDASEPQSQEFEFCYALLTIQRNEFICEFCDSSYRRQCIVIKDLAEGSDSMNPVIDILKSGGGTAIGKALNDSRDKPILRCENCTKSPEEIGENIRFMLCSSCKIKLKFSVHYCSQACQKEDWSTHKKYCGKEKVTKQLRGTVRDPYWQFPEFPDHLRCEPSHDGGGVAINSIGFGKPHPSFPHNAALQRQVSLITGDKDADYFLFDEVQRPVRFIVRDTFTKMAFRILRSDAMFGADRKGLEALAEYMIKMMEREPGLSRERILAQLSSEYGEDITAKVKKFEGMAAVNGYPGITFVEMMSKTLTTSLPRLAGMNSK